MARRCDFCSKRPQTGHKISHSNIKTKIRHFPNLQRTKVLLNGIVQRAYACTRCIRSGVVTKPPVSKYQPETVAAS